MGTKMAGIGDRIVGPPPPPKPSRQNLAAPSSQGLSAHIRASSIDVDNFSSKCEMDDKRGVHRKTASMGER